MLGKLLDCASVADEVTPISCKLPIKTPDKYLQF